MHVEAIASRPYTERPKFRIRWLPVILTLLLAGITALLLWRGWSFYRLGLEDRVEHPDFRTLRPSGFLGNGFGYVGALLIVANLTYLARRKHWFTLGSMRAWLDLHVFTGLIGSVFVVFHSAFQLRTSIARTTALSLAIVVVTGLVGRFLYAIVARLSLQSLPGAVKALDDVAPGYGAHLFAAAEAFPVTILPADASAIRCLGMLPTWRRQANERLEAVSLVASGFTPPAQVNPILFAERVAEVERAVAADVRGYRTAAVLRSWRSLHRLFALLMLLAVAVHIGVAWHYGYRWIFGK